jgi:hypothetical protein
VKIVSITKTLASEVCLEARKIILKNLKTSMESTADWGTAGRTELIVLAFVEAAVNRNLRKIYK